MSELQSAHLRIASFEWSAEFSAGQFFSADLSLPNVAEFGFALLAPWSEICVRLTPPRTPREQRRGGSLKRFEEALGTSFLKAWV
jgi:hypothetical protein